MKKAKINKIHFCSFSASNVSQWHKGVMNVVKCKHEGKKLQPLKNKGVQTQIDCINHCLVSSMVSLHN